MFKKAITISLCITILIIGAKAQVPSVLNYQGVARNSTGTPLSNQSMQVRLSILNGSANGSSVYSEVRSVVTNAVGLFVIQIGSGGALSSSGNLGTVNWNNGSKFLKVEIDPLGGNSFIDLGTNQLVSVPYALTAAPSGTAGGDLSGTYPNPLLADKSVTTQKIADLSVSSMKLSDQAVTTAKIADGSVTDVKIQSVSGSKVTGDITGNATNVNGTVAIVNGGTGATTAAGARTNLGLDKIDNTSDANKPISILTQEILDLKAPLASPTFTGTPTLPTGTIAVTQSATDNSTNIATTAFVQNSLASGAPDATLTATGKVQLAGDLGGAGSTAGAPVITNAAITTVKIADANITTAKLADASVTTSKLAAGSISTTTIIDAAVTDEKIASISGSKVSGDINGNAANVTGTVAIVNGGTGAITASEARSNLGLTIGTDILAPNDAITGATKTKITYDAKGLVISGADATTADIAPSTNRNYVTDVQSGVLSNTSGVNTGDQTITLTGDVTGSGTGTFTTTIATGKITNDMLAGNIEATKLLGTDITTVGTITSGTWSGTTIAIENGGTGSNTKSFVDLSTDQTIAGDKSYTGAIRGKAALSAEITADLTINSSNAEDYNSKILICNPSSGPITITFNSGLPDGFNCMVLQKSIDANVINFAGGTSVIMKNRQSYTATAGSYAMATVVHIGSNVIVTAGDMQ